MPDIQGRRTGNKYAAGATTGLVGPEGLSGAYPRYPAAAADHSWPLPACLASQSGLVTVLTSEG